mgnify:CR=1 FL=1
MLENVHQKAKEKEKQRVQTKARAKEKKIPEVQDVMPKVKCEGIALANKFNFKYLGSIFGADGNQKYDVQ